jgi:catechol 2,3-dioxygenase-like lactoylglutathione lyase family enzyme
MTLGSLAYIALVSNDVDATCKVFGELLELPRTDLAGANGAAVPVFSIGRAALAVLPPGDPMVDGHEHPGLHHMALAVDDLDRAVGQLAAVGLAPEEGAPSHGLGGRERYSLPSGLTCGLRTCLTRPLELAAHQPGIIERIDHVGVASADVREAEKVFAGKLGFEVESRQTDMEVTMAIESFTSDKYGVVYHNRKPQPVGGLRITFITVGDCELEFLANFDPRQSGDVDHGRPGDTRQDQGAITRFVQSRGPGLHHLALKSPDIDATLARLHQAGTPMIDLKGRPGSRRARIGFAHPKGLGGILMHVVERD